MTMAQFRGLTLRMLLFAAAALVPVLLLMTWMGWLNTEEKITRERTRAGHLAELLAREQALPFALGRQKLYDVASMRGLAEPLDANLCHLTLKRASNASSYLTSISLYSPDGVGLCSSLPALPPGVADRDWFKLAVTGGRVVVSDYLVGRVSARPVVVMALPLSNPTGGTRAVLVLGIDLAWMGRALADVPVAEGTNIVVVDSSGTVLAPQRWLGRSVADHPVFRRIAGTTAQTSFEALGIDGVERIFVARPLNPDLGGKSYLWVAAPKSSAAAAALRDFLGGTVLVFATVLALFAAIWWEGSRIVLRPVRQLREAARRLGGSQLSARTNLPHSDDEMGQLAASFDEMAVKIETREHELERSRESLLRANRMLRMLTTVKDAIVRAADKQALFDETCRAVAAVGGYPAVYVARAEHDADKNVTLMASVGIPDEYRANLGITWADGERGRGVAGTAIRENRALVIHDVGTDPRYAPWRELAKSTASQSIVGLPVRIAGQVWGVLAVASTEADVFDAEEALLLQELADELGRGIETLRLRAEKHEAEQTLRDMMEELEQHVEERTRDLEAANRDLQSFSYSVSHDLRTPLRSIEGFAQALDEECGAGLSADGQDYLARIRAAARRMGGLIEDMIRLAHISHAKISPTEVDLSALAAAIGAELAALHPERQVRLTVMPGLFVRGDPGLLRALMQNLLDNAWKYTAHTPRAEVEFGLLPLPSGERAYVVRDNGAGFDMAFVDRLFRPFSRLHREEDYAGSGIGLATVARIVTRHGGRVWVEAEKNKGANFHFVL